MAEQICAHEDCDCIVRDGDGITDGDETYCSRYCAKVGPESVSEECECGHEACV